jgi:hypothetical protein
MNIRFKNMNFNYNSTIKLYEEVKSDDHFKLPVYKNKKQKKLFIIFLGCYIVGLPVAAIISYLLNNEILLSIGQSFFSWFYVIFKLILFNM